MLKIVTAAFTAATIFLAPVAHAEPENHHDAALFCRIMDQDPTPEGVLRSLSGLKAAGATADYAADVVHYALTYLCPEYRDEVQDAYDIYVAPQGVQIA